MKKGWRNLVSWRNEKEVGRNEEDGGWGGGGVWVGYEFWREKNGRSMT